MRAWGLWGAAAMATLGGCAIVYGYGDYEDAPVATPCATANECPGEDNECGVRACKGGVCAVEAQPAGTPALEQTAGDCQMRVCDGKGSLVSQSDDMDVPDDGNECTQGTCNGGVPAQVNLPDKEPCGTPGATTYCDGNGQCTGCTKKEDCGGGTVCRAWECNAMMTCVPVDQNEGGTCAPGSCVNEMYTAPSTCQAGACVPGSTGPCPSGQACGNASACSPCIKCNQWLNTPTDPMTVNWCPGSQAKYQALHDCACGGPCDECLSSLLCNDLLVLTPGCQTCIQSACPNQEDACKADTP